MSVAIVHGSSKGIGFSFVKALLTQTPYKVISTARSENTFLSNAKAAGLDEHLSSSRLSFLPMDLTSESSIESVAKIVSERFGPQSLRCVVNSAGYLLPEKSIKGINFQESQKHFMVNTFGPLLVAKHFTGLLAPPQKSGNAVVGPLAKTVWINMSARTGSIGDNHLGGWYSYRMSKAALNQLTKTLAAELGRKGTIVTSLHPGTVDTDLSREYTKNVPHKLSADESVDKMMAVILSLGEKDNGAFIDQDRKPIVY